ncbi:FXYD domain-containing ion transport regulator 7 isoform X2 [Heterocephalus glaber]|uniref:FXYD domain-containing ion transport regulator n=1 Tax=Heterocephalus glaber TaxID=10181 RepID=A0AAX6RF48_HETGA|nr:FXYD domain-containing ion transport regulator 7 isoform X2 [Heterocephalus glaber]
MGAGSPGPHWLQAPPTQGSPHLPPQSVLLPAAAAAPSLPQQPAAPCSCSAWRPQPRPLQMNPAPEKIRPNENCRGSRGPSLLQWEDDLCSPEGRWGLWQGGPEEFDPFFYDYATVQTVGLTLATIMFLLGIIIIISKKVKCRKADSSPTCKSCKSELPSSAPGGGGV